MSQEAERRRDRSFQILRAEAVPYHAHLLIEDSTEARLRSVSDIVERTLALTIVAFKATENDHDFAQTLVAEWDAARLFTPDEAVFIEDADTSLSERNGFSWRWECVAVLLWALGIRELSRPDVEANVAKVFAVVNKHGPDGLRSEANPRTLDEVLDQADLIYRYHWAVRDAYLNGREIPARLHHGVVAERHYALNWLISFIDAEWDDVDTGT